MTQPYAAIRDGDAPLCSANDFGSRMIRWASRSQWSHCAIAFRMREIDRVLVLECVQRVGVRAVSLSDFVCGPDRAGAAQDVLSGAGQSRMADMAKFAFTRPGDKFPKWETVKTWLRIALGRLNAAMPSLLCWLVAKSLPRRRRDGAASR